VNNVTLRDIAGALEISTGNLAYHYKNKDHIIKAAFEKMQTERDDILSGELSKYCYFTQELFGAIY